jgi:hypothetical protein
MYEPSIDIHNYVLVHTSVYVPLEAAPLNSYAEGAYRAAPRVRASLMRHERFECTKYIIVLRVRLYPALAPAVSLLADTTAEHGRHARCIRP